mmetsp:Transcript_19313/g.22450  ORF Transcript_19313/g.22450 Transcript_19313/m.22450 type:complete len:110 (-) Transcript_19313:762-1091(-)
MKTNHHDRNEKFEKTRDNPSEQLHKNEQKEDEQHKSNVVEGDKSHHLFDAEKNIFGASPNQNVHSPSFQNFAFYKFSPLIGAQLNQKFVMKNPFENYDCEHEIDSFIPM